MSDIQMIEYVSEKELKGFREPTPEEYQRVLKNEQSEHLRLSVPIIFVFGGLGVVFLNGMIVYMIQNIANGEISRAIASLVLGAFTVLFLFGIYDVVASKTKVFNEIKDGDFFFFFCKAYAVYYAFRYNTYKYVQVYTPYGQYCTEYYFIRDKMATKFMNEPDTIGLIVKSKRKIYVIA